MLAWFPQIGRSIKRHWKLSPPQVEWRNMNIRLRIELNELPVTWPWNKRKIIIIIIIIIFIEGAQLAKAVFSGALIKEIRRTKMFNFPCRRPTVTEVTTVMNIARITVVFVAILVLTCEGMICLTLVRDLFRVQILSNCAMFTWSLFSLSRYNYLKANSQQRVAQKTVIAYGKSIDYWIQNNN